MTTIALARVERPADSAQFLALFSRLCVALRETQDDSGVTQRVYWDALADVPLAALEAGAQALMREQGRRWFPTTAEWREAAARAHEQHLRAALKPREEPWRFECADCQDTGWVVGLSCDGGMDVWPEHQAPHTNIGKPPGHLHHRPWSHRPQVRATVAPTAPTCGRTTPHLPHDYTRACPCRATNATYRRHQAFGGGAS